MKLEIYDQFEFGEWESESLLVIASESKNLRSANYRVNSLDSFFKITQSYEQFIQWQKGGLEQANKMKLSEESECVVDLNAICKEVAGFKIDPDTHVYMCHSEWNLVDFVWEDENSYCRVVWCMTA